MITAVARPGRGHPRGLYVFSPETNRLDHSNRRKAQLVSRSVLIGTKGGGGASNDRGFGQNILPVARQFVWSWIVTHPTYIEKTDAVESGTRLLFAELIDQGPVQPRCSAHPLTEIKKQFRVRWCRTWKRLDASVSGGERRERETGEGILLHRRSSYFKTLCRRVEPAFQSRTERVVRLLIDSGQPF